jgi:hypothetical protein
VYGSNFLFYTWSLIIEVQQMHVPKGDELLLLVVVELLRAIIRTIKQYTFWFSTQKWQVLVTSTLVIISTVHII